MYIIVCVCVSMCVCVLLRMCCVGGVNERLYFPFVVLFLC